MNQNFLKNYAAFKIEIPRNGCKTNKSLSRVTMQEASEATANSRNLLSLGSRQSLTEILALNNTELLSILFTNTNLSSAFIKYLSNFSLNKTSINSSVVLMGIASLPKSITLSKACRLTDVEIKAALIKLFVSIIKNLFFIFQYFLKNVFCKAAFFHGCAQFIQVLLKLFLRICHQLFSQTNIYFPGNFFSLFLRGKPLFFTDCFVNLNYYSFHNNKFYVYPNLQKLIIF
jgi:hypothetical protein